VVSKHQLPGGGLPAAAGRFVGRHAEVQRINTLLSGSTRLLTLVGPGGIGKTRLAAEALRQQQTIRPRRIYWTRLARLARGADAATVAEEIAQSIAKADIPGRSAWAVLLNTLTDADATVLVLDNCEHVTTGAGIVIADLIEIVPTLTIVATSREPIGWVDERILTVPPLPPSQALDLLRQRAELIGHPIGEEPEQTRIAEQICRRVDQNPLFIRLAAARFLHKPPAAVLRELTGDADDQRLHWPERATAGVEQRHRGVRDVIAWSYDLCEPEEQLLLDRLSVFAAGFESTTTESHGRDAELAAIVTVCADECLPDDRIGRSLERLVDRSLVTADVTPTTVRYYLPESVRVFAQDQLRQRGSTDVNEVARLAARHRRYYRDNVVAGESRWYRPQEGDWLDWLRPAWDNILTAIETSLADPTEAVVGLEIATTLISLRVPLVQNADRVMTQLTERALEATAGVDAAHDLRVRAMAVIAWIMVWRGRIDYSRQLLDECVALTLPDAESRRSWRASPEIDIGLPASVEFAWGLELLLIDGDPRSATVLGRAREKSADAGDVPGAVRAECYETIAWLRFRPRDEAMERARRYRDRFAIPGAQWTMSWAEIPWVHGLAAYGNPHESLKLGRIALARHIAAGDRFSASWLLGYRISALVRILGQRLARGEGTGAELRENATEIAHLSGGLATLRASIGIAADKVPALALANAAAAAAAKSVLGETAYAAAELRGAQLRPEFDEVQRYALGTLTVDSVPIADIVTPTVPSRWNSLSRAERDVAVLAAAGWTNRAIAGRRGSSVRTVDAQVASIRQKLLITSRADIAAHVPDELAQRVRSEAEHRFGQTG
jgi:predicted ATPase/DNA-binding CsgD family transcriptional regulator